MNTYSVNEAAEIIGIKPRAVQHRCKRDNIRKKDNKYLITDEIISLWRTKEEETNAILNAKRNPNATQLDVEIESLKTEIETLKAELSQYDILPNERLEIFTNDEYILFEQRLKEWQTQRLELEHQEKIFNIEIASKDDIIQHYKNQFEYQKKQSTRILDIHEKLVETIGIQTKNISERNIIEAIEKDIIDKNTRRPK